MKFSKWSTQNRSWANRVKVVRSYLLIGTALSSALVLTLTACGDNSSSDVTSSIVAAAVLHQAVFWPRHAELVQVLLLP